MSWREFDIDRFSKIMALSMSDHDGEALVALRKAQKMLIEVGCSFEDVAELMRTRDGTTVVYVYKDKTPPPAASASDRAGATEERDGGRQDLALLSEQVEFLMRERTSLKRQLEDIRQQLDAAVRHIVELESQAYRSLGSGAAADGGVGE